MVNKISDSFETIKSILDDIRGNKTCVEDECPMYEICENDFHKYGLCGLIEDILWKLDDEEDYDEDEYDEDDEEE